MTENSEDITLFVDLENMHYADLSDLHILAAKYGGAREIRVYHHTQSAQLWDEAKAAGVSLISPPSPHEKTSTDMVIAADMVEEAIWGSSEWIGLISGDVDYLATLSLIKRRTNKKILVVSRGKALSLRLKAMQEIVIDELEISDLSKTVDGALSVGIIRMILTETKVPYWTARLVIHRVMDEGQLTYRSEQHIKNIISSMRRSEVLTLKKRKIPNRGATTTLILNDAHPLVKEVRSDIKVEKNEGTVDRRSQRKEENGN